MIARTRATATKPASAHRTRGGILTWPPESACPGGVGEVLKDGSNEDTTEGDPAIDGTGVMDAPGVEVGAGGRSARVPTSKENSPSNGCPSSLTTRHSTSYSPSESCGNGCTTKKSPSRKGSAKESCRPPSSVTCTSSPNGEHHAHELQLNGSNGCDHRTRLGICIYN